MLRVKVNYSPTLSKAEQKLATLQRNVEDLRPLMIGEIAPMTNRMLQRFWDSKGSAYGQPWAPWARSTAMQRLRKGNAAKGILRDTDNLYGAIFRDRPTDSRLRNVAGGLRFQLNTQVPYAAFLHYGTKFMPARHVFPDPLPPTFIAALRRVIKQYLLGQRIDEALASA